MNTDKLIEVRSSIAAEPHRYTKPRFAFRTAREARQIRLRRIARKAFMYFCILAFALLVCYCLVMILAGYD